MEFTGERFIPDYVDHTSLFEEHMARYYWAGQFVRGRRVLDLGCGTGYGSYYLSQQGASLVVGSDVAAQAIAYAAGHYRAPNLHFVQSDARRVPLAGHTFDLVVSFEVIEHLPEVTDYLVGMRNLLTEQGWLIGSTPNRLVFSPDSEQPHNRFHYREYTPAQLEEQLKSVFEVVHVWGQRPYFGFVIGPVPGSGSPSAAPPREAGTPAAEFLPAAPDIEQSVADSMYLIFLAGSPDVERTIIQTGERSRYYVGRATGSNVLLSAAHYRYYQWAEADRLQCYADRHALYEECHKLTALVRGYESGRYMRLTRALRRWGQRLLRRGRPPADAPG